MIIIPITMILYLMAFRYIFGNKQFSSATSILSTSARAISSNFLSSPEKIENVVNLVRTAVPFTSAQTVSKVNTYLPMIEKTSTLLGMYSFLNRAQNYSPIEPMSGKSSMEKITSLMMKNKAPLGKMIAQPMLANGMEKIMANAMKDMVKNINLGDLLAQFSNASNSEVDKSSKKGNNQNSDMDLSSLLQTFMPLLNSMMTSNENENKTDDDDQENYNDYDYNDQENNIKNKYEENPIYVSKEDNYNDHSEYTNEHSNTKNHSDTSSNKKSNTYNNKNSSEATEKPKPIRIRQKRYRY